MGYFGKKKHNKFIGTPTTILRTNINMSSFGGKMSSMAHKGGKMGAKMCPVKKSSKSSNKKAGLTFPIGRVARYMKKGRFSHRVGKNASVFMSAVLEYVVAEVMEV